MARRGKLSNAMKVFLVQQFACFATEREAAEALNTDRGVQVSPEECGRYDPARSGGADVAPHLRELFDKTRARFLNLIDDIPEANKAVRVNRLARMSRIAEEGGDYALAVKILEIIAKETGNFYTNKYEHTGAYGKPIQFQDVTGMTPGQIERSH